MLTSQRDGLPSLSLAINRVYFELSSFHFYGQRRAKRKAERIVAQLESNGDDDATRSCSTQGGNSTWLQDLYKLFAPVREEAKGMSEEEINMAIDQAIRAVREKNG